MVSKPEVVKTETEEATPVPPPEPAPNGNKKEKETAKATEEKESRKESSTPIIPPPVATAVTTTKSGRASKPSTPALVSTFAEASAVRSRPSRNTDIAATTTAKRSHKKGASSVSASAVALAAKLAAAEEAHSSAPEDEDEGEEPRYCYCNNVSYGEMVACDADGCVREWFHLGCVGLKVAPKGNGKLTPSLPVPRLLLLISLSRCD